MSVTELLIFSAVAILVFGALVVFKVSRKSDIQAQEKKEDNRTIGQ